MTKDKSKYPVSTIMRKTTTTVKFSFNRHFISLVWTKAMFNLKSEVSKTHLSYLWWILEPVLYMMVFYVVFGLLLERGGPGFVPYLLVGLVPFQWLSKSIIESSDSILQGKNLMLKVRINPLFFPLSRFMTSTLKGIPVFILLLIYLLASGYEPAISWLALPWILSLQAVFTLGLCFVLSMVIPYLRDLRRLIPLGIQFILFSSGVFYTTERIPSEWIDVFFLNPVACLFHLYHQLFLQNKWPDPALSGYIIAFSLILFLLSYIIYKSSASSFARIANQ